MTIQALSASFIVTGRTLFLGGLAYSLFQHLRGRCEMESILIWSTVGLLFFCSQEFFFQFLQTLSSSLVEFLRSSDKDPSIFSVLVDRISSSDTSSKSSSGYVPGLSELSDLQSVVKTGVWGVLTAIIEFLFIIIAQVLTAMSESLIVILKIVSPLAAGVILVWPNVLLNQIKYAFEISLWVPCLNLLEIVIGSVSRTFLYDDHGSLDLGLKMVAVQLAAIILFLMIPKFVHRLVSGHLGDDMGLGPQSLLNVAALPLLAKAKAARGLISANRQKLGVIALVLLSTNTWASYKIVLYPGYLTKIYCSGKLLLSGLGNEALVQRSALPKEIGCGVLLKPIAASGETNLFLETSTRTISAEIVIGSKRQPSSQSQYYLEAK